MTCTLVLSPWMGRQQYSIEHSEKPLHREHTPHGETRVAITDDQAALGVDVCAALFETGRLG